LNTSARVEENRGTVVYPRHRAAQLGLVCLTLAASGSTSLLVTLYILGRAHPLQATWSWLAILMLTFLTLAWQQLAFLHGVYHLPGDRGFVAVRRAVLPAGAVFAVTACLNVAFYASDDFNFKWIGNWAVRTAIALIIGFLLFTAYELQGAFLARFRDDTSWREALRSRVRAHAPTVFPAILAAIGLLEAWSFVTTIGDDYARYWTVADALSGGWGYPASEVGDIYQKGGMSGYLVDLPALPLAMMLSFALLGHTVLGAMAPTLVVTPFFPLAAYLALRELTNHTIVSFVGATALGLFPLLSFYVLRSGEPDGIFITLLMAMAFLAIRCDRRPGGHWGWAALGLTAGIVSLLRPEGIMFSGTTLLTLALRNLARPGLWEAGILCGAMVAAFAALMLLTYGTPWPSSFVGTVRLEHVLQNLDGFMVWSLPRYSESLGVPIPGLLAAGALLVLLYLAGSWQLARRKPQLLFLALLPAMSVVSFLLVSPWLTRPPFPYDFFRRASYGLPFLVLVAAYPIALALGRPGDCPAGRESTSKAPRHQVTKKHQRAKLVSWCLSALLVVRSASTRGLALCSVLLVLSVLLVSYEAKLDATPEAIYPNGTPILTSGSYLLATDIITHPFTLPTMTFEERDGILQVADSFDYMAFRADLTAFFRPLDLHGVDRAASYARSSLLLFLLGFCYAVVLNALRRPART